MKKLIHPVTITIIVVIFIFSLPFLLPEKAPKNFSDEELRQAALTRDMAPVPTGYDALLKVVDNPENPMNREKIALGKELFFDPILSQDKTISCATCHNLQEGGDDNIPTAIGYQGQANPSHLNSPTVLNAALAKAQFWDGRAKNVEEQAGGPIQAPFEMHMTPTEVEERLNQDGAYVAKFKTLFPEKKVTFENVRKAIGAYERTLLTRGAYDRFLEGDNGAISAQAKRGMTLFITKGCKGCHTGMSVGGQSIQKFPLRKYFSDFIGMLFEPDLKIKESPFPFVNEGGFLGRDGTLKFRVPILRNITKTAPYFHNGSVEKLEEAVRIMSKYQIGNEFTPEQIDDVVAFLKTLEGKLVVY
ncbi:MAG: cytochrome C peroxidase [Epsilonproteobacteria bacterium (ex Lamellibrachia satsuma)]|nr:MAG: cytochrome C peroxidase [Epsilonproteobacteria bacterium (ex Lamellibrachia satsuma)]